MFSAQLTIVLVTVIAIGVADAAFVVFGIAGAGGAFQYVPRRIWLAGPLVWLVAAGLASAVVLPFTRRRAGEAVASALGITFVAIRLRSNPAIMLMAVAALAVLLALISRIVRRWLTPRAQRAMMGGFLMLAACAMIAAAQSTAASPAATPAGGGPNVIVIFLDTVRYDAVFDSNGGVHSELTTLARLRRESTVFTRAYATTPWTLPSHLSAVTGLPAHELGVSFDAQVYTRREPTLAERFRARGYRTAAVISNSFVNAGSGFARGFDNFQQAQTALDVCRTAPGLMADTYWPWFAAAVCNWTAGAVTRRALSLMNDEERPFFLALNYMDAHDPYYVERGCGGGQEYAAALRCVDRNLTPIVDWRSPRRPTVLAIVGDHGEQFGEHGLQRHGNSLYVQLLHVPFMIRPAADAKERTSAAPISIAALPSLLEDVNRTAVAEPVLAMLHPPAAALLPSEWSALDGAWHLIVRERGPDALYHLGTDPAEEHNVIVTAPAAPAIERLRAAIQVVRRSPRPDLRRFRSLGYVH